MNVPSIPFTQRGRLIRKQLPHTIATLLQDWLEQVREQYVALGDLPLNSPLVTGLISWFLVPEIEKALTEQVKLDKQLARHYPVPVAIIPLEDLELFQEVLKAAKPGNEQQFVDLKVAREVVAKRIKEALE